VEEEEEEEAADGQAVGESYNQQTITGLRCDVVPRTN